MAPPKDIARSYPKRGLTADVGFRSEPKFCGDGSVEFDGSTQGANVATTYDIGATGAKTTLAAWVNFRTSTVSNADMIVGNVASSTSRLAIYQTATNTLMAGVTHASGAHLAFGTPSILNPNRWYFCAATFDKDTATLKFYLDGVEFNTVPSFGGGGTAGQFEIGARFNGGSPTLHFDGRVANAMMIEDVLTQSEIVELMRDTTYAKAQTFGTVNRYYVLDADFNDSTGSHNATSYGSPSFTVDRPQLPRGLDLARGAAMARVYTGRCVDFDGGADGAASTATLNINTSGAKATLACWVNPDGSTTGNKTIVSNAIDTNNNQFTIYQNGTSYAVSAVYASGFTKVNYFADSQVKVGAWTFLCAVWDFDTTSLTFYVDGVSFTDTPSTAIGSTNGVFEIGCRDPAGSKSQLFDGQIASIKLFDTTLTAAQVRELYHNPEQVLPTGVSASNLRRYYPLSDYNDTGGTGGRYFQDMGADGEPAEDKGSALMSFAQPVPCPQLGLQQSATRLRFPGGNTTHNAVATTAALGTTASVSCWFQVENTGSTRVLWAIGNALGTGFLEAYVNSSDQLQVFGQSTFTIATITDSNWHHLVVTTDSGSPPYKVFLDNSEVSLSGSDTARNFTNGTFEIGNQDTVGASFVFQGILNDVACWNTELGSSDVSALYNSGIQGMDVSTVQSSNLKGWWKCDDLTTLKDYSGNGANATVTNTFAAASFPENASGSTIVGDFSMKRKGVSVLNFFRDPSTIDSRAVIPAQESVFPKYPDGFTVSVFFRLQKRGVFSTIYYSTDGAAANQNGVYVTSANQIWFEAGDGGGSATRLRIQTTTLSLDGDWHHYAATITHGTPTTGKAYFDGVLNATDTSVTQTGSPALSDLTIGDYMPIGSNEAAGPIACLRFYRGPLSDNEIEQIYNSDLRLIKGLENE